MNNTRNCLTLCLVLTLASLVGCTTPIADKAAPIPSNVFMVCKHGAVKSVMAVSLFNKEAEERGLPYRAFSRGITLYESVPAGIAKSLEKDGFDVADFKPQKLSNRDVANSARVVAIGIDLAAFQGNATAPIVQWNDIPPASVDYEASKMAMLGQIQDLLAELENEQ